MLIALVSRTSHNKKKNKHIFLFAKKLKSAGAFFDKGKQYVMYKRIR